MPVSEGEGGAEESGARADGGAERGGGGAQGERGGACGGQLDAAGGDEQDKYAPCGGCAEGGEGVADAPDGEGLAGRGELLGFQAAGDDLVLAGEEGGHGAGPDFVGGGLLGGVGAEDAAQAGVAQVVVVGFVLDPGGPHGAPGAGNGREEEQGEDGGVEDGDDGCGRGNLGGGGGEDLGVEDQVAGLVGSVGGGLAGVLELGVLVGGEFGRGGGGDDPQVGFPDDLRGQAGGGGAGGGVEDVPAAEGETEDGEGPGTVLEPGEEVGAAEQHSEHAGGRGENGGGEQGGGNLTAAHGQDGAVVGGPAETGGLTEGPRQAPGDGPARHGRVGVLVPVGGQAHDGRLPCGGGRGRDGSGRSHGPRKAGNALAGQRVC
ncbi:hypothetical protein ACIRQY_34520 [Streptomyces sp. NPDC101490]|uniref:hypothetical protein n=1 Tax=Streptomyces sp. NPDC101490 TaxID=3366143 RepID=UPI00382DC4A4